MSNPDEAVAEFVGLSREEVRVAEEHKEELLRYGASSVHIHRMEDEPSKVNLWGPSRKKVDQAAERFAFLCKDIGD